MRFTSTRVLSICLIACSSLYNPSANAQCGLTAGPSPGSIFFNGASVGTQAWTQPQNAITNDNVFATVSVTVGILATVNTNYLAATGFGFNIPPGSTICGVTVTVVRQRQDLLLGNIVDNSVKLINTGSIGGTEHASATSWSTTKQTVTYGGPADLWGLALTPTSVSAANFGVGVSAKLTGGPLIALLLKGGIDFISITITYTGPILAINLQGFSATRQGNADLLNWTASSDNQADQFIVQRSGDSKNWQALATIPARTNGNQANDYQYSYTDNTPLNGTNFYRLFLKNADAGGVYSAIQEISQTAIGVTCYPNPIINEINISSPVPIHNITLRDMQGRTIQSVTTANQTNTVQLPAAGLPPGIYLVQVDGKLFKMVKQ